MPVYELVDLLNVAPTAVKADESGALTASNNVYGTTAVDLTFSRNWEGDGAGVSDTIIWTMQGLKTLQSNWDNSVLTIGGTAMALLYKNSKNSRICNLI